MNARSFILFGPARWNIAIVEAGSVRFTTVAPASEAEPDDVADVAAVVAALKQAGYAGEPVALAIDASLCLAASIAIADLPRNDALAMLYRLEEKLPLAAESIVADFILPPTGSAESALGVCAALAALGPLVEALESAGVAVRTISPALLLAAQEIWGDAPADLALALCGQEAQTAGMLTHLLAFHRQALIEWHTLPASLGDLTLRLDLLRTDRDLPGRFEACAVRSALTEALSTAVGQPIVLREGDLAEGAARLGGQILSGRRSPWINLRRGPLAVADPLSQHRRPLNTLLAAVAATLALTAGVLFFRAQRYERERDRAEQRMTDAFRQKFPGWPIPVSVRTVVQSERRKAAFRSGAALPPEAGRSALLVLVDVLAKLPADAKFTLGQMTFEETGFQFSGRVRSYEDVDALAAAARSAGLAAAPPTARRESDGFWSFTLSGVRAAAGPTAGASARSAP